MGHALKRSQYFYVEFRIAPHLTFLVAPKIIVAHLFTARPGDIFASGKFFSSDNLMYNNTTRHFVMKLRADSVMDNPAACHFKIACLSS